MALSIGELVGYIGLETSGVDKALGGVLEKMRGGKGKISKAAGAIGGAAALALGAGLLSSMDVEKANAKLSAQLGATGPESARLGKVAGALYAKGYGDSIDGVNDAIASVVQNIDGMRTASSRDLQQVSGRALDLSQVMGEDVGGVTRAVSQLMRTGLAKNANEAFDILARGATNGTNKSQDLLDTFNEYSTEFRNLGISGQQALGLIDQGLKAGARDSDKVGDALKEFSIRAVDGSKTTAQGFKMLGLNADKMAAKFGKGGKVANSALTLTLNKLRGIKDPVERSQAAVALFGTQAEDLGKSLYALDPSTAVGSLGKVGGSAKKMGKTLHNTSANDLESFKRQAKQTFGTLASDALPVLRPVLGFLKQYAPILSKVAIAIGLVAAAVKIWTAVQWLLDVAMDANPIGLIITGIGILIGVIIYLATKTKFFQTIWKAVWGFLKAVGAWFAGPFANFFKNAWNKVVKGVTAVKNWIVDKWNAVVNWIKGIPGKVWGFLKGLWDKEKRGATIIKDWIVKKFHQVISFISGLPGKMARKARGMWNFLKSELRGAINGVIRLWNSLDFGIRVKVPSWVPVIGGKGFSVPDIIPDLPYLAEGGVIPATPGGRLAVVGEGRQDEAVAPLDTLAGMIRDAVAASGGTPDVLYADIYIGDEPIARRVRTEVRSAMGRTARDINRGRTNAGGDL